LAARVSVAVEAVHLIALEIPARPRV
jgi:hypothetical protein